MKDADGLLDLLRAKAEYEQTHKLEFYDPYDFQRAFHNAEGLDTDQPAHQKALMAANQIGKTLCGGSETAIQLTGRYQPWYEGPRFGQPIVALCGSNTNETTRDIVQKELLGDPADPKLLGTGSIPKEDILETVRKPGVPNAYDSVTIRHHPSGGISKVMFRAYEQGAKKHMGHRIQWGWCDEEPPLDIWSQYLRGTFATNGYLILTFTPEEGITEVVNGFLNELKKGQKLITATWDDAPHMDKDRRESFLQQIPTYERDMRSRGIPTMGSGLVFPLDDNRLMVDPIEIPSHWARIIGIDFGWDHPFAAVWMAHDRDTDTVYVYKVFRESKLLIPLACDMLVKGGAGWIPVMWPHDGMQQDPKTGQVLAESFRERGVNMHREKFSNPPEPGKLEGTGGNGVEAGLLNMLTYMEEGRFKVFSHCKEWFQEKATYHRKDGKVVKVRDDVMSATRYGFQMLRHAHAYVVPRKKHVQRRGLRNWQ